MISVSKKSIALASSTHIKEMLEMLETKKKVLNLCLNYYGSQNKIAKQNFNEELQAIHGEKRVIIKSVNFFLLSDKRKTTTKPYLQRQIKSTNKTELFFKIENRKFPNSPEIIQALSSELNFLDSTFLEKIVTGYPSDILVLSNDYNKRLSSYKSKKVLNQIKRLLLFLIDYDEFSKKNSIYSPNWGAYELTNKLEVRSCLYCNRNFVMTVMPKEKIIRPELDHFFPKSIHPLLALSFYNLIPSCHTCNSNLKGKINFNLENYFHPYMCDFDKACVKFTYKPLNPKAFFGDSRNIKVKLNRLNISHLKIQIEGNIKVFKLDEIYNEHVDIISSLQLLQLKTNRKKIRDIFENILVDSDGKKYSMNEREIYELAIRNYFSSEDFVKKPLAKFEKDIAEELGLIVKKNEL